MKRERVEKVFVEMQRLNHAIGVMYDAFIGTNGQPNCYNGANPRETGAVRRASLDLTRALADMRKSVYEKLPGEK